jgi:nesprin-1
LVAQRADEGGLSEQRRLEGLISRYKGLIPIIETTMQKIDIYTKSYAYKEDLAKVIKMFLIIAAV